MRFRVLRAIDIKVLRDAVRMGGQLLAIALVIACGVGVFLGMRTTMRSLESARVNYYAHERFADVFAGLMRAPEHVADRLRSIPGVQRLQTRVVADVTLDIPGMVEPAVGRLVSIPDRGRPEVNDIRLRSGRLPEPGRGTEIVVSEAFALAHDFHPGAQIGAIINGSLQQLKIVGTALSPEFIWEVAPGMLFPDNRRFGVIWMHRSALGPAFDMKGAFNDVVLQIGRGVSVDAVIQQVDETLARFGGLGAIPRADQVSAFFIENELKQLNTFAVMVPMLFLAVAAFLLNIVVGRIVAGQREQIAALKAVGYRDREVGLHFGKLVGIVVGIGVLAGVVIAATLGSMMTSAYTEYYRFPDLPYQMGMSETVIAVGAALVAAAVGTWAAIRRTIQIPPAEAMRPEAPAAYRPTLIERLGLSNWLPPASRMVLRELERRPLRATLSVAGIALATSLMIVSTFFFDSVQHMLNVQFGLNQREDVQLALVQPRSTADLRELEHLPGVMHAEPYRAVPVRLRAGPRSRSVAIMGLPSNATLHAVLDENLRELSLPPEGLVLSAKLAAILGVRAGDSVRVEVLEGHRPIRDVPVARIAQTYVGLSVYMELGALARLMREERSFNGAWLLVDDRRMDDLHAAVKATPVIAGATARHQSLEAVQKIMDESLGTSVTVSVVFSLAMAFGVLYNAARITLAERARDLASLRVLGFRRREVGAMLLGEIGLLTVIAVPVGLWIGWYLSAQMVRSPGFDSEQFRLPLAIAPATYAIAALTVLVAAVVSGWAAWRKLDRIDIVEVLKTRD